MRNIFSMQSSDGNLQKRERAKAATVNVEIMDENENEPNVDVAHVRGLRKKVLALLECCVCGIVDS